MAVPTFKLLRLSRFPILEQLRLEQALLRCNASSWLLVNDGTPDPAIVMGISGFLYLGYRKHRKLDELVRREEARKAGVTVIRRFSGGGTVAVDSDTVFATLIADETSLPEVEAYPRPLMQYTERLYRHAFGRYGNFRLRENDYCFGEKKFGGNAQAITRQRWLHHTTFLWDFQSERMQLLRHPANAPAYREGRGHLEFVCKLRDKLPSRDHLLEALPQALQDAGYKLEEATLEEAQGALQHEHLKTTRLVEL